MKGNSMVLEGRFESSEKVINPEQFVATAAIDDLIAVLAKIGKSQAALKNYQNSATGPATNRAIVEKQLRKAVVDSLRANRDFGWKFAQALIDLKLA